MDLVGKHYREILDILALVKEGLQEGLVPRHGSIIEGLPLIYLVIVLADLVCVGGPVVTVLVVAEEPAHGRQPINLTDTIYRLYHTSTGHIYPSKLRRLLNLSPCMASNLVFPLQVSVQVIKGVTATVGGIKDNPVLRQHTQV